MPFWIIDCKKIILFFSAEGNTEDCPKDISVPQVTESCLYTTDSSSPGNDSLEKTQEKESEKQIKQIADGEIGLKSPKKIKDSVLMINVNAKSCDLKEKELSSIGANVEITVDIMEVTSDKSPESPNEPIECGPTTKETNDASR